MKSILLQRGWWQWQAVLIFTAATFLLPFLMHLITPLSGVSLGIVLLPVFYAPLVAAYFYRFHVALTAALLAPGLNYLITGHPLPPMVLILSLELGLFVTFIHIFRNSNALKYVLAPLAYLIALFLTSAIMSTGGKPLTELFLQTLSSAWMGVIVLWLINLIMLRIKHIKD